MYTKFGYNSWLYSKNYQKMHQIDMPVDYHILLALISLFSPLGKPADRAICFTFCSFFLLDQFSQFFHHMEGICVNVFSPVQFF